MIPAVKPHRYGERDEDQQRYCRLAALMSLGAALDVTPAAAADGVSKSSLLQAADRMIASCLQHAAASKLPPPRIVVVDATGVIIAAKRQDGAPSTDACRPQ
jgi:hypothetical protein